MSGKRLNDTQSFDNIQALNKYIKQYTADLEPIVGERAQLYVALRPSWSWNGNQLQDLLVLVRYEVATIHLSKSLDCFREGTDFNDEKQRKKFLDIARTLNASLRDIQTLKSSLGLTVAQTQGDLRALKASKHKELQLRELSTDGNGQITNLDEARARAKSMLLQKVSGSVGS